MISKTRPAFWRGYARLSPEVRARAREAYRLFASNPSHPSLRFKKLESSGNRKTARLRTGPMTVFSALASANFKFVVVEDADVDEVRSIATTFGIAAERITLMPEGTTEDALRARGKWLVDRCREYGFRLGTRLHVVLWGSERGR